MSDENDSVESQWTEKMGGSFRKDVPDWKVGLDRMIAATGKEGKGHKNEKMGEDNRNRYRVVSNKGECMEHC